jgi:glyoxylase-like metal-dependent hydrolase (beta-lactamase superfamily II)
VDVIQLLPQLSFLWFPVGHAYPWADPDGLTLIDTGVPGSGPLVAEAIRGLGRRPEDLRRVMLTHFHEDHAGSAADIVCLFRRGSRYLDLLRSTVIPEDTLAPEPAAGAG